MCFILLGAPRGLGKTGGLIPGINGELPGNCVLPGIGMVEQEGEASEPLDVDCKQHQPVGMLQFSQDVP